MVGDGAGLARRPGGRPESPPESSPLGLVPIILAAPQCHGNFPPKGLDVESRYQPIENYGIIGNLRTAALVGMDGSIDWLCWPHFDSPSVFAAILDDRKGGRFRIAPAGENFRHKQFYWPETAILVTR